MPDSIVFQAYFLNFKGKIMIFADYKCNDCGSIMVVSKKSIMSDWDSNTECDNCHSYNTRRLYNSMTFDVARGYFGNSSTGYKNEHVYMPSIMGKVKGIKIVK